MFDREDLTDPYFDVASAEGVLEWCINDYIIPNSITLSDSLKIVSRLSKPFLLLYIISAWVS